MLIAAAYAGPPIGCRGAIVLCEREWTDMMNWLQVCRWGEAVALLAAVVGCTAKKSAPATQTTEQASVVPSASAQSSRAYKGHQNDKDINALVAAFPQLRGTRLDDCHTCHTGGTFTYQSRGKTSSQVKNSCDYCHLVKHPSAEFGEPQPKSFRETLNPFGVDYAQRGRSAAALESIRAVDSDRDGFSNQVEIDGRKYPGDPQSKPGQKAPPLKLFTTSELKTMPKASQFMLANLSKHRDYYATYGGVKVRDLLAAAGVNPADPGIRGITLVAPDGYLKDIPVEKINQAYPSGVFYAGLDKKTLGESCGFVQYPQALPPGVSDRAPIPGEPWLLLSYERDGAPLDPSRLDIASGKVEGEGPYRLVVPQSVAGPPDRGSSESPSSCSDDHDFDPKADHNAGDMVRGVVAIRINPLPEGYEDFDSKNGGWAYVGEAALIVYGYGIR